MGTVPGPRAGEGAGRNDLPLLLLLPFPAGNLILGLCEMVKGKRQIEGVKLHCGSPPDGQGRGFGTKEQRILGMPSYMSPQIQELQGKPLCWVMPEASPRAPGLAVRGPQSWGDRVGHSP